MSDYHSRHHQNQRKMLSLLIEDMHLWSVPSEDYETALRHLNRADTEDERHWRRGMIRTFGTCLTCFGDGCVDNPRWNDEESSDEPESVDCETCRGAGVVKIVDKPEPVEQVEELPF